VFYTEDDAAFVLKKFRESVCRPEKEVFKRNLVWKVTKSDVHSDIDCSTAHQQNTNQQDTIEMADEHARWKPTETRNEEEKHHPPRDSRENLTEDDQICETSVEMDDMMNTLFSFYHHDPCTYSDQTPTRENEPRQVESEEVAVDDASTDNHVPFMTHPDLGLLLTCPLTKHMMIDPVTASDGCTYERSAISEWVARMGPFSPVSWEFLSPTFYENYIVSMIIRIMRTSLVK
jgi:hypothetical protein